MQHANSVPSLAAGAKSLPSGKQSFADTQALWRFLNNPRVTAQDLSAPLLALAGQEVQSGCDAYVLAVHDWSRLNFGTHQSKRDRVRMTHEHDVGYELQSTVLVADRDGSPLCAPVQNLRSAEGLLSSRWKDAQPCKTHLDELSERIAWLEEQKLGRPLVHVIDREGDSVGHLRQWSAGGRYWLVRAKEHETVSCQERSVKLGQLSEHLPFEAVRQVHWQGRMATQWIASTVVVLTRPARPKARTAQGQRAPAVKGAPVQGRLVISQVRDDLNGKVLAQWYLLCNLPQDVDSATVALWYYWRWRIESYFKLLKEAGQQVEHWEQESAPALFKRLLIAAQACALAWRLMRQEGQFAERTRAFLVRLSGRQMKRSRPVTASALLAGIYMLLTINETLEHYSPAQIAQFVDEVRKGYPPLGKKNV